MNDSENPTIGKYQHHKGNYYDVIGVGKHTETQESVVIYRPLYDSDVTHWVRPLAMFCDTVTVDGVSTPRFKKVSSDE